MPFIRRRTKNPRRVAQAKADKSLQDWYRKEYAGTLCEVCGRPFELVHHFVPKSQSNFLRYHHSNLIFLCKRCHFLHHNTGNPLIHAKIIQTRGLKWLEEIIKNKRKTKSPYTINELYDIMSRYEIKDEIKKDM